MEVMRSNPSNHCNSRLFYACHLHENGEGSAMKNMGASIVSKRTRGIGEETYEEFCNSIFSFLSRAEDEFNLM